MKKIFKIIGVLLGTVLLGSTVFAAGINAGIGAQQYMTKTGVNIVPIVTTYEFGSTTRRWAKGWFTDLDVSGIFTFGGVMGSNLHIPDDLYATFGNTAAAPDARLGWNTAQTVDGLYLGTATGQNTLIIAENGDVAFDFAHGAQTNPTLFIHSAAQGTTQWLSAAHNQTDAIINAGLGSIILDAPEGIILRDSAVTGLAVTTDGTDALWTVAAGDNINIEVNGAATLTLQQATFTPGATHTAVDILPTWNSENFTHQAVRIVAAQNGANTQSLRSLVVSADKITGATTLAEMTYIRLFSAGIDGTVTALRGIQIANLGNANATSNFPIDIEAQSGSATNRAIRIVGTGVANAIELGDSPLIYSSGAEVIRFMDSTNGGGLGFTLTAAGDQTIATTDTGDNAIVLQNQTFTAGAAHEAVQITPTWATENFIHTGLLLTATQTAGNSTELRGATISLTKTTGATTLEIGTILRIGGPTITGAVTTMSGIVVADQSTVGGTNAYAISIDSQTANAATTRAIQITGTGINNAIRLGNSPNIYSPSAGIIRFTDSTDANGLVFESTAGATQEIKTIATTSSTLRLQGITFTPGGVHNAIIINPLWTAENFVHRALRIEATQNGANTQQLFGLSVSMAKATAASILDTMSAIGIAAPTVTGTVTDMNGIIIADQSLAGGTTSYGINIASQTANATTTRAIEIAGTGVNNAIRLGASPNIYSTGADTIRFSDATVANGFIFTLAATALQSINTISGTNGEITFQNQTFTAGAAHSALSMRPFWASENFNHTAFDIIPTQNGANTEELRGLSITMTKATGATTLGEMVGILLAAPSVTGTVTDSEAISILAQGNAGIVNNRGILIGNVGNAASTLSFAIDIASQTASATISRAIRIIGTGASNAIELGDSPLIYSSGAEVIRFDDSTAARGISFTLTAAGNQTIAATAGGLTLNNNRVGIGIAAGANSDVLIGASANDVAGYRMSVGYTDTSTTGTIRALNSEMTANPGAASDASYQSVSINTYTSVGLAQNLTGSLVGGAYFVENRLNAANTLTLAVGSSAGFTNTTGITTTAHGYRSIIVVTAGTVTNGAGFFVRPPTNAGTLVNMIGLDVSDVSLAGGTTAYGLRIQSQSANATTTRAIEIAGGAAQNGISFGTTGILITNDLDGAITFLGQSAGSDEDFTINLDDTANTIALSSSTGVTDIRWDTGVGVGQFTLDGSTGGCIMLRDTDDAGFTEVDALDGVLTASIDADGQCD